MGEGGGAAGDWGLWGGIPEGMDYEGFDSEYGRVLAAAGALDAASLTVEVARLRALADAVHPPADQEAAQRLLLSLDNALSTDKPALSESMSAALRVHRQARTTQGSPEERIARLRAGIAEIGEIAEAADPNGARQGDHATGAQEGGQGSEKGRILELGESLSVLLESVRLTLDDKR